MKRIPNIFSRYIIIIALGLNNLYIIYKILTPLTIQTILKITNIFTNPTLSGNIITFNQTTIQLAPSCIAGSAFYLLLALLLSTPVKSTSKRIKSILTATMALFAFNITRILILIILIPSPNFETIHWIFWHIISTLFVAIIYIATIKHYKIKSTPIISDLKYIRNLIKPRQKSRASHENQ